MPATHGMCSICRRKGLAIIDGLLEPHNEGLGAKGTSPINTVKDCIGGGIGWKLHKANWDRRRYDNNHG